jgi:hypothetical protein
MTPDDTSSEAWRHETECRHVANMRSHEDRARYVEGVAKYRGAEAAERLRNDVWKMMRERAA